MAGRGGLGRRGWAGPPPWCMLTDGEERSRASSAQPPGRRASDGRGPEPALHPAPATTVRPPALAAARHIAPGPRGGARRPAGDARSASGRLKCAHTGRRGQPRIPAKEPGGGRAFGGRRPVRSPAHPMEGMELPASPASSGPLILSGRSLSVTGEHVGGIKRVCPFLHPRGPLVEF